MQPHQQDFLELALTHQVLRFGQFTLKSGRISPYFFNLGQISSGAALHRLAGGYAATLQQAGLAFDALFGPAYKGIPLAAAVAMALAEAGQDVPFAYNRKEAKDHGEGGVIVGHPLQGRVLIIDDVISAGTSVRESVEIIRQENAEPAGVVIALDRQERGQGDKSAVQDVEQVMGIPVAAIARLQHLIQFIEASEEFREWLTPISNYRQQYGIRDD